MPLRASSDLNYNCRDGCGGNGTPFCKANLLVEIWLAVATPLHPRSVLFAKFRAASQGTIAMISCLLSDGRVFGLAPLDWSVLFGGSVLRGLLTFLF